MAAAAAAALRTIFDFRPSLLLILCCFHAALPLAHSLMLVVCRTLLTTYEMYSRSLPAGAAAFAERVLVVRWLLYSYHNRPGQPFFSNY